MDSPPLHMDDSGQGTTVVLLHGMPSPPRHFDRLRERLQRRHRVLVPHLPGYGRTPPHVPARDFEARDAELLEALCARGVQRAHLVGFSGGALRALFLATSGALQPLSLFTLGGLCELSSDQCAGYRALAASLREGADITSLARELFLSPAHAAAHPGSVAEVESWVVEVDRLTLAAELDSHGQRFADWSDRLAGLTCPVVARAGSNDRALPFAHSERLAAAAGERGELQRVEAAGHALLLEDFESTAHAIEQTLERADAAAS